MRFELAANIECSIIRKDTNQRGNLEETEEAMAPA